jgi:hypothetical protein
MKSHDDQIAVDVLAFMAQIQAQIKAMRRYLAQEANKAKAMSFVEVQPYESSLCLSICIEAEVEVGRTLTWWMDIIPQSENWLLDGRISWNGNEVVFELHEQIVPTFHAVQREAPQMLNELITAGKQILKDYLPLN